MFNYTFASYPMHWQILFQKPATTMMEGIIDLHHDIMAFLVIVFIFVLFMLTTIVIQYTQRYVGTYMKFHRGHGITHNTKLETIWTIMPTIILLFIATPSFALVYALDEIVEPQLTVRVVGRQWYWTYEYPDTLVQNYALSCPERFDIFSVMRTFVELEKPEYLFIFLPQKTFPVWYVENYNELLTNNSFTSFYNHFVRYKIMFQDVQAIIDFMDNIFFIGYKEAFYDYYKILFMYGFERMFLDLFIFDQTSPLSLKLFFPGFSFDSYLIPTEDLFPGSFRLLEVDRRLVLPVNTNVRLLVTAYDVLHSWAVPAFGVKIDAVPGRLNEYFLNVKYTGVFYGQCSEICGVNHGFMPIKVEVVLPTQFFQWFALNSVLEAPLSKYRDFIQVDPRAAILLKGCSSFLQEENFMDLFWLKK